MITFFKKLFGGSSVENDAIKVISAADFKDAITKGKVQLVDVRSANEFRSGAIKGSKNIDFFKSASFTQAFEKLNKEKPVYVYCQSGNRSKRASQRLAKMGFTQVFDLKGGFMRWPY